MNSIENRDVIIEFFPLGSYVRVSAMDVSTLTEISIQGPITTPEPILKRNAMKRLEYVMRKKGLIE